MTESIYLVSKNASLVGIFIKLLSKAKNRKVHFKIWTKETINKTW